MKAGHAAASTKIEALAKEGGKLATTDLVTRHAPLVTSYGNASDLLVTFDQMK